MPPLIPPVPLTTKFTGDSASGVSQFWLNWFQAIRRQLAPTSGPYANDAAAKAAGIAVGQQYYLPTGAVSVRLT